MLFQEMPYHFFISLSIGLIPHREVDPCLLVHDALIVGECVESGLTVVSTHAAFPEAAEAHLRGGKVDDGVVDAASAEAAARGHLPCGLLVRGEDVQRQRMWRLGRRARRNISKWEAVLTWEMLRPEGFRSV